METIIDNNQVDTNEVLEVVENEMVTCEINENAQMSNDTVKQTCVNFGQNDEVAFRVQDVPNVNEVEEEETQQDDKIEDVEGQSFMQFEDDKVIDNTSTTTKNSEVDTVVVDEADVSDKYAMKAMNHNCYEVEPNNKFFQLLQRLHIYIWMMIDGDFALRIGEDGEITIVSKNKLKMILKNKTKLKITIDEDDSNNPSLNLDTSLLQYVSKDSFNPHELDEFYEVGYETHRNKFRATEYMLLDANEPYNEPTYTLKYIDQLCNNVKERSDYFINWFAFVFVFLIRPMFAFIFTGKEGTGKDLFVNSVISPLFGEKQVSPINKKSLNSNFTADLFADNLFYVFNEIDHAVKKDSDLQNFIKEVITNKSVRMDRKYVSLKSGIELFGACIFFTNKAVPVAVEPSDRRFTIYRTGQTMLESNFLGLGSYDALKAKLDSERRDFALYLKNYPIDKKKANIALNTPEKEAIKNVTNNWFQMFHKSLMEKNMEVFEELKSHEHLMPQMHRVFTEDIKNHKVNKNNLNLYFQALNDESISNKKLLEKLRTYDSEFYDMKNTIGSTNGDRYFLFDEHPRKGKKDNVAIEETQKTVNPNPLGIPQTPPPVPHIDTTMI
jgi:hypothetical protein